MSRSRLFIFTLITLLLLPQLAAQAGPYKPERVEQKRVEQKMEKKLVKVTKKGDAFCFDSAIVHGNIVIARDRCYTFYLVRTMSGAFLAFGPPGPPMIPPGQLVRMNTPAGAKTKGRLFYLVPLAVPVTVIPVDTIRFVPVQVTSQVGRVVISVPGVSERPEFGVER